MEKHMMEISKSWCVELWHYETERGHREKEDLPGRRLGSYNLKVRLSRRRQQE